MTIRNIASLQTAYRNYEVNRNYTNSVFNTLSSGYRINSAADDAAGLAISEKMRGQIRGLSMASQNAQNGISLIQTAEGTLSSTADVLGRMRELAVQASNGAYTDEDRSFLAKEMGNLKDELDRVASSTNFNGINLLDGSLGGKSGEKGVLDMGVKSLESTGAAMGSGVRFTIKETNGILSIVAESGGETVTNELAAGDTQTEFSLFDNNTITLKFDDVSDLKEGVISNISFDTSGQPDFSRAVSADSKDGLTFQIGANGGADQRVSMQVGNMSAYGLGVNEVSIGTLEDANNAIKAIDSAIRTNSGERSGLGAMQNRLEHTLSNLGVSKENLASAESTIRDADMAKSIMDFTRQQILNNANITMMAQSNNMARSHMMALLLR